MHVCYTTMMWTCVEKNSLAILYADIELLKLTECNVSIKQVNQTGQTPRFQIVVASLAMFMLKQFFFFNSYKISLIQWWPLVKYSLHNECTLGLAGHILSRSKSI